jgi:signal transduction histidine kinase
MTMQTSGVPAPPTVLHSPPFARLERDARRLQIFLALFGLVVALAPATVFFFFELDHLGKEAVRLANHYAIWLHSAARGAEMRDLPPQLRTLMEIDEVSGVRLLGRGDQELAFAGQRPEGWPAISGASRVVTVTNAPLTLVVELDGRPLVRQITRVFGIHALVALLLSLAIYRLPVRAVRRAARDLEITEAQLLHSEKLRTLGEVYAGLTHEINNPLGIILTRVKLLLGTAQERALPADVTRDLEAIDKHGARIADIVRGLLAFSRKTELAPRDTDLNQVLTDVLALVEKPFARHEVKIESQLAPGLPHIQASPDHLQQVFLNLVKNAREAMPEGGTISVRTRRNAASLVAEVLDTGTGISPSAVGHLFEPFFTTKDVGKGVGLGLSVSYGIVKAHGGEIEAENRAGKGAVFRVILPLERRPA